MWDMDWVDMALDIDRWWTLVNAAMKLQVQKNVVNLLTS
jgi:hypothetical protein